MHRFSRLPRTRVVYLLALLGVAGAATAQPDIGALVAALSSEDAAARQPAIERAASAGSAAIIAVAPLLDDARPDVVHAAGDAIGRIVEAARNEDDSRKSVLNALTIAALATKNRNPLIAQLGAAGGAETLPVLANLLDEAPDSFDAALEAVSRIGATARSEGDAPATAAVCDVLVARLDRFEGRRRGAVMRAVGVLTCTGAEDRLIEEVRARTPASADAATALGETGGEPALDALWSLVEKAGSRAALDACLKILARLPDKRAVTWYADLLNRASARLRLAPDDVSQIAQLVSSPRVVCVLIEGIGRASSAVETVDLLLPFLDAKESDIQAATHDALIALRADGATEKLIKKARKAPEARRQMLIEIVEARKGNGRQ